MINRELVNPQSIVIVGGSNNVHKPGGRLVRNLLDGKYRGELYVVNRKETDVQGLKSYPSVEDIPETEMAILSIPSTACPEAVEILAKKKGVRAFIVISAGLVSGRRLSRVPRWRLGCWRLPTKLGLLL